MFNGYMLEIGRQMRGLTQVELAKAARVDQGLISRMENGWALPDADAEQKLADALEFPLAFFHREGKRHAPPAWAHLCKVSRWP